MMEENKSSDFQTNNNGTNNNLNPRPVPSSSNPRPVPSCSTPRPGPSGSNFRTESSNSSSRPGTSSRLSSSNDWMERDKDRKIPKKRSHSDNDDWRRETKKNRETSDQCKQAVNSENDGNERLSENSTKFQGMNNEEMARAAVMRSTATISQQSQSQMAVALSQQSQSQMPISIPQQSHLQMAVTMPSQSQTPILHQSAIPYSSYGYSTPENYIEPSQATYGVNPYSCMMPINSQWSASNGMPPAASNVASTSGMGISNGMEMIASANGSINGYPYMNMGNNDGGVYGMLPSIPNYFQYTGIGDGMIPMCKPLEKITVTNAVLSPPLPGEKRTRRPKPPGCRTVYVGNLPEKITDEIIKEVFQLYGPISVIRMSQRNYCHIRFQNMESVDQAIALSGFRIQIDGSEEREFNGKLHVDYAIDRDDQHEYECLERARIREERKREALRPPSPYPIPDFSEDEASSLTERLGNEETCREGLQVLITWLERGECNKKSSGTFYSLIQSSHSHVKRLRNEKNRCEEEAEKAKENLLKKNRAIGHEINEIEKVFVAAKTQKVWDHFTRSQRKKMEEMKLDTSEFKKNNSNDLIDDRAEEDMELSDNEDRNDDEENDMQQIHEEELNTLREKINTLTQELNKAKQIIEELRVLCSDHEYETAKLRLELEKSKRLEKAAYDSPNSFDDQLSFSDSETQYSPSRVDATENESQLISLISIFLHVHPFGASIDYICSYLVKVIPSINARDVESLLRRFPNVFHEVCTGIGATLEKKWTLIVFKDHN